MLKSINAVGAPVLTSFFLDLLYMYNLKAQLQLVKVRMRSIRHKLLRAFTTEPLWLAAPGIEGRVWEY